MRKKRGRRNEFEMLMTVNSSIVMHGYITHPDVRTAQVEKRVRTIAGTLFELSMYLLPSIVTEVGHLLPGHELPDLGRYLLRCGQAFLPLLYSDRSSSAGPNLHMRHNSTSLHNHSSTSRHVFCSSRTAADVSQAELS